MTKRSKKQITEQEFLAGYDSSHYEKPSVTVDMLIFTIADRYKETNVRKNAPKGLQVLLIKRGDHPFLGKWALPGGFVGINESIHTAAYRELKEETNVDNIYMEQLYTWGEVARDPRTRVISVAYLALVDSTQIILEAGDDAVDARWFFIEDQVIKEEKLMLADGFQLTTLIKLVLDDGQGTAFSATVKNTKMVSGKVSRYDWEIVENFEMAFDHAKIMVCGLERLRNKVEYTDIAFNLMPDLFTLTELQQVYEVLLGKDLLTANFRRKIAPLVTGTNQTRKEAAHRPSQLFKFNQNWTLNNL